MPKRKTKFQKRIDRLTREKYELLRTIEQLLRERDDEPDPALNEIRRGDCYEGAKDKPQWKLFPDTRKPWSA